MVQLQAAGGSNLTDFGRLTVTRHMFEKGVSFLTAAALLDKNNGHPSVVLHLLCQERRNCLESNPPTRRLQELQADATNLRS